MVFRQFDGSGLADAADLKAQNCQAATKIINCTHFNLPPNPQYPASPCYLLPFCLFVEVTVLLFDRNRLSGSYERWVFLFFKEGKKLKFLFGWIKNTLLQVLVSALACATCKRVFFCGRITILLLTLYKYLLSLFVVVC